MERQIFTCSYCGEKVRIGAISLVGVADTEEDEDGEEIGICCECYHSLLKKFIYDRHLWEEFQRWLETHLNMKEGIDIEPY